MTRTLVIHEADTVAVALTDLATGELLDLDGTHVQTREPIPRGHKVARKDHAAGGAIVKYGCAVGHAKVRITAGEHVHSHNLATSLNSNVDATYAPIAEKPVTSINSTWRGFRRSDGRCATRNEIWIIPTVGCVARTAETLARDFNARLRDFPNVEGVHAFPHAFGCSQIGDDLKNTQRILAHLVTHPNAGAVLVLGLGCENNHWDSFRTFLGPVDSNRVRYLGAQTVGDEHEEGLLSLEALAQQADGARRESLPVSALTIGLKCGGSDGFSGITANPMLGRLAARLAGSDGRVVLTEVPEMFGAERTLLARCADLSIFNRAMSLIRDFRQYYADHGQPVYENPSPGNKEGGITTLEEKSLGCVQKAGDAVITDVIEYAGLVTKPGLTLLQGPGNDQVSCTALAAAGCDLILFTTGRGTPLGCPVPTLKVASNHTLAERKPNWIDFDAGVLTLGAIRSEIDVAFMNKVLAIAGGERTRSEDNGQRDIAIFKDGVTL